MNSNLCLDECLLIEYAPIYHTMAMTIFSQKEMFLIYICVADAWSGFYKSLFHHHQKMPSSHIKKSPWQGAYQIEWKGHKTISSFDIKLIYDVIMLQVEPGTPFITQAAPRLGSELCANETVMLDSCCRLQFPTSSGKLHTRKCFCGIQVSISNELSRQKVTTG